MQLAQRICSNLMLKIMATIIGCCCWLKYSYEKPIKVTTEVPVSFYNLQQTNDIDAPETVAIVLQGKRADLYQINTKNLAIHVDAESLHQTQQKVLITAHMLLLPKDIHLFGQPHLLVKC